MLSDLPRRDFMRWCAGLFGLSAASIALSGCSSSSPTTKRGVLLGGGQFKRENADVFVLAMLDLDNSKTEPRLTDLSFLAHGIVPHPQRKGVAMLFPKHGETASEVDFVSGKVLRSIASPKDQSFYGHGAYSTNGTLLYAT